MVAFQAIHRREVRVCVIEKRKRLPCVLDLNDSAMENENEVAREADISVLGKLFEVLLEKGDKGSEMRDIEAAGLKEFGASHQDCRVGGGGSSDGRQRARMLLLRVQDGSVKALETMDKSLDELVGLLEHRGKG